MKKIIPLLVLLSLFNVSYSQTIEITKITVRSAATNVFTVYTDSDINLLDDQIPYVATKIEFSWNDFDLAPNLTATTAVRFILVKNDGSTETLGNSKTYFGNANSNSDLTDADFITSGHKDFSIRAIYTNQNGDDQIVAESNAWTIKINPTTNKILGNSICCDQRTLSYPYTPNPFNQTPNTQVSTQDGASITSIQWEKQDGETWTTIYGATQLSYTPGFYDYVMKDTKYRRVLTSSSGATNISNSALVYFQLCDRPAVQQNIICGNRSFYNVKNGDLITPSKIIGSFISPTIIRREFGYDYMISTDGITWYNAKPKQLLSVEYNSKYNPCGTYYKDIDGLDPIDATGQVNDCSIKQGLLDLQLPSFTFNSNLGNIQHIYIKRDYYHWYDPFDCGPWGAPGPCKSSWYFQSSSNIVTITLTTGDEPKPVPPITSSRDNVTCNWSDQTINFSVPQMNNQEYYKWEIPSSWAAYTALKGPYANQISVNTNNAGKNFATGGEVCLTVTQGGQSDRQCKTITGTAQFYSIIPTAPITACEGQTVVLKPVLYGADTDPNHYTYNWAAYQSITSCNNPAGTDLTNCKELKITVGNVRQNPNQEVSLTTTNAAGCIYKSTSKLIATPGLQMGILNTYNDPTAIANSGLAVNTSSNNLYFTAQNKNIYRTYYDNADKIWKYVPLKDKNTNKAILSDGPVVYYKGTTDKLFFILNFNIYYAESTDNELTWINYFPLNSIANAVDPRIKIFGNNIYYIDNTTKKVFYKDINISNPNAVLVGNIPVNYSQRMFTVEDGILTYADQSNNIVAFDALTGVQKTINVPSQIKQVNYNSSISTYNSNIYYTSSSGALRILKKNVSTGIYDNYEEVNNLQLAGPFAINKQTGTLYAKAYDVLGKQIYYLNNKWNTAPIDNILSYSPIQSDMTYANGHAYYIGDNGYLSNTYYIAPCIPQVLRTVNTLDEAGDVVNDPLTNTITEDRSVVLYPNPTTGVSKVTLTIPQKSIVQIKIVPIEGGNTDVKYNAPTESGTQDISFDMSMYAAGIYIVQVYVDGTLYANSKLIKY